LDNYLNGLSPSQILQAAQQLITKGEEFIKIDEPSGFCEIGVDPAQLKQVDYVLQKAIQGADMKRQRILDEIRALNEEMRKAEAGECQEHPYHLHAILVHDGSAESGHYYAFIFDRAEGLWYRFNDYRVTVECENVVFEESFGGVRNSCAYGIIYVNSVIAGSQKDIPFSKYSATL